MTVDRPSTPLMAASTSGTSLLKNSWCITQLNHSDVVTETEFVDNVEEVYMLALARDATMQRGATSFKQAFDGAIPDHVFAEATLQLMLHTLSILRNKYEAKQLQSTKTVIVRGEPFEMYLEAVLADEPDPTIPIIDRSAYAYDGASRVFMKNVPENVPVIEYRVWIFVRIVDPEYDFALTFMTTIKESAAAYQTFLNPSTNRDSLANASGDLGVSLSSYSGPASIKYGQTLSDTTKYRLITSLRVWAQIGDAITGIVRLEREMAQITSNTTTIIDNKANPRYVISPLLYFEHPHAHADPRQKFLSRYLPVPGGRRWKYPVPDCVVRVPVADQSIERFREKLLPDYQAMTVGDEVIDNVVRRMRDYRAKAMHREIINKVPVRSMAAESGLDIDFSEIDEVMPNAAAVGDLPGSDIWLDPRVAELRANAAGVSNQVVAGGMTMADIKRIIDSVPATNDKGEYVYADATRLASLDFEGSFSLSAQNLMAATDTPDRSSFHLVLHTGARLLAELRDQVSAGITREEARVRYLHNQARVFRDFRDLNMRPSSNVSTEGVTINRWLEKRRDEKRSWLGNSFPIIDKNMSTFGNMMARRMAAIENDMYVTSSHLIIVTILFGTLDAYRHEFNLHFNALLTGPNSAGKSFICNMIKRLRINETVHKVDDETGRASFVDTDHNDRIDFSEEVKPDQFRTAQQGGDDKQEASWKEVLTSMQRVLRVFSKTINGKRTCRVSYSQQIAAFIGATNLESGMSEPILSRFSCWRIAEVRRSDRCTSDMQGVERTLSSLSIQCQSEFIEEMNCEQALSYYTQKLIAIHALTDVTTTAFDAIKQIFRQYLRDTYGIAIAPRTIERAHMILRQLVITTRLAHLFSNPQSKYYKQPFEIEQLKDLDPLLRDDEETACWALEALRHEIVDNDRPHIMTLLNAMFIKPNRAAIMSNKDAEADADVLLRNVYLTPLTAIRKTRMGLGGGQRRSSKRKRNYSSRSAGYEDEEESAPWSEDAIAGEVISSSYMYAYYRFPGTRTEIARQLSAESFSTSTKIEVSTADALFEKLSKDFVKSSRYRWNTAKHEPEPDPELTSVLMPALIDTVDAVFIAIQLFSSTDPIMEAIRHTRSLFIDRQYKYITASIVDNEHPYLLKTTVVNSDYGYFHKIVNYGNQVTGCTLMAHPDAVVKHNVSSVTDGSMQMTCHYNEMSRRARATALYLDPNDSSACSVAQYEDAISVDNTIASKFAFNYPKEFNGLKNLNLAA